MITIQVHKSVSARQDVKIIIAEELELNKPSSEVDRDVEEDANALLMALKHIPSGTFIRLTTLMVDYRAKQGPQKR